MRLRNILNELENCKETLELKKASVGGSLIKILNFGSLIDTLFRLNEFSFLKNYITPIEKEPFFSKTIGEVINLSTENYNKLEMVVQNLKKTINLAITILKEIVSDQDTDTISLKLYDMKEFEEFVSFNDDLYKKILRPITLCGIDIEIGELEEGSRWQSLIIHSYIGLSLLFYIFRAASDFMIYDVQKNRVVNQIVETYIEIGKSENELNQIKADFEKARKNELGKQADGVINELKDIVKEHPDENVEKILTNETSLNELCTSIQTSIDLSYKYIDKGLEIYQSLNIPEEKRIELPNFQELLSKKQQLLIENKK